MYKILALVAEDRPFGVAMNALAHVSAGLASRISQNDADVGGSDVIASPSSIVDNSGEALEVRFAPPDDLRRFRNLALDQGLTVVDFVNSMTGDTYVEQLERTRSLPEAALTYYAVIVAGKEERVRELAL